MQVSRVNTFVQNNHKKQKTLTNNQNKQQNFNGALDKIALGTADLIENGGLVVSFTLQDMLGTNLPRPIMGLMRNSKENDGKKNFSFAAKEVVREFLTGPSMFIIPGIMLGAGGKTLGKTVGVPMEQIKAFGEIHAASPLNATGKAINQQEFYQSAFTEILKNAKHEEAASSSTIQKASDFARRLYTTAKDKAARKETLNSLSDEFVDIAKKYASDTVNTDFTAATIKNSTMPFSDTVSNMTAYASDVVEKVKNQDGSKIASTIKNLVNKKTVIRFGMNIAMISAILAFLKIIPKLYNKAEGKENAGLTGLMKDETLNDKSLNAQTTQKTDKKDKANPSFGSAATAVEKAANKLTSSGFIGKFARGMEFEGINVSFPLLLSIMGFGILLPRTKQAKDKYDREEILRRDVTTCATMCFGEKALRKGFSKASEKSSGMVLANKPANFDSQPFFKKVFDYIRPIKGVNTLTTPQIVSKYSGIDNYKDGITGFCNFINGQKGNLSKVFSLTDESKSLVQQVLGEGVNIANADNKTITEALTNAKDSEPVKRLVDLFKDKNNPWVTKAKTLNARFTAFSVLILVPVFLGFMLPWINERATKKRIKEEQALNGANNNNNNTNNLTTMNLLTKNNSKIFADMTKFV